MFLNIAIILIFGIIGGIIFDYIRLPRLIWYLILGILIGPSLLNIVDEGLLNISSYLRQIALVIILTRSGLSLDLKKIKEVGRPAILMCFIPASFEIIGVLIFAPLFFHISIFEALLLGSVLAAVSPAIIVPRMIKLIEDGVNDNNVPEVILAGATCDDIFVIVLFYTFKGFVATGNINFTSIFLIPISIILGIILGLIISLIIILTFKKISINSLFKAFIILGSSFLMIGIESLLKPYIGVSSLIGILTLGIIISKYLIKEKEEIKKTYNSMWSFFEILLFVLVGCATNVKYAISIDGLIILGIIIIALIFRSIGVIISISFTKFNLKEKLFIIISYIPKATVQASIGGIALAEGLSCGEYILTGAVISILLTAPVGAILIDNLYKKLLIKNYPKIN